MKIIYITTIGSTMGFFTSFIKSLLDHGDTVDIATNENNGQAMVQPCYREWGCKVYHIDTSRSPLSTGNLKAVRQIRRIVERGQYDLVHCHTPLASVVTRQACKSLRNKNGLKVLYTAHGFHFYDGAPLKNWLTYYPVELYFSRYTDVLITINKEDYKRASKHFKAKKTVFVPGVGVDVDKFATRQSGRERIRRELNLPDDRILLLSVGELNDNKNHKAVINAIAGMPNLTYAIAGKGALVDKLQHLASEASVDLRLLGFRSDVADIYDAADIYILPSIREGLNVSLMEAMASSLACLAGRIRGNVDLLDEGNSDYLFDPSEMDDIRRIVKHVVNMTTEERHKIGATNLKKIRDYDLKTVESYISEIYRDIST